MIKTKELSMNEDCYVLYVEVACDYISFRVEKSKFLGILREPKLDKDYYRVGHNGDIKYVQLEDIFKTELDALTTLKDILCKNYP